MLPPPRPIAPYFTFDTNGNNCYCKPSMGQRKPGQGAHLTSGTCSAAPTPPPTPQSIPNFHACVSEVARAQPYCNATLSYADRAASLVASLTLDEKVSRMYSCVDTCDTGCEDSEGSRCEAHVRVGGACAYARSMVGII